MVVSAHDNALDSLNRFLCSTAQTAEKSPTGRFFWQVSIVCLSRGIFSYKIPLFFNTNVVLKNSTAKAPDDKS